MHQHKLNKKPKIFVKLFNKTEHKYPTRYPRNTRKTRNTSFAISYWGLNLWNKCLDDNDKVLLSMLLFSSIIKSKLLDAENETSFISF